MDFRLNPCPKLPHRGRLGSRAISNAWANRQLVIIECLLCLGNELNQAQSSTYVCWGSPDSAAMTSTE